jgi:hypothetical protein
MLLSDNSKYLPAFSSAGGDALGGGLLIPAYYFLENGWRVRPIEANQNLIITGNLFVKDGGIPVVSTLGTFQVVVNYTVPVQAQGISTSGSSGPSALDMAAAVRLELQAELARLDAPISSIQSGSGGSLTASQTTMLLEMYELLGLDPAKPLIVSSTSRTVIGSNISQTITSDATQTIVTRQ